MQDDIRSDPWISIRTKKYMSGPKRYPFKNYAELRTQYRKEFSTWFLIGAGLTWPIAILIGRRATMTQGGVSIVPNQRYVDEFPNVYANKTTNKFFKRYAFGACILGGFVLGRMMSDDAILKNETYTRPDLKPFPAMVREPSEYDNEAYQQMLERNYLKYRNKDVRKEPFYRLLWPEQADFTPKKNWYAQRDSATNYNPSTGAFPHLNSTYADHRL